MNLLCNDLERARQNRLLVKRGRCAKGYNQRKQKTEHEYYMHTRKLHVKQDTFIDLETNSSIYPYLMRINQR